MDLMPPIVRLVLLVTFSVAGIAKLKERSGTARTLTAFGIQERWSPKLAIALSLTELLVAAALLWTPTVWLAAWGAAVLLIVFLAGILYNLARGRKPPCNCFGQLTPKPIGASTVIRNLLLLACAGVLLSSGAAGTSPSFLQLTMALTRLNGFAPPTIALAVLLLGTQLYLTVQVLQQQGRILQRLGVIDGLAGRTDAEIVASPVIAAGLAVGSAAPAFSLQNLLGEEVTLRSLLSGGRPLMMLFMSPACGPCVALAPEASQWMADLHSEFVIVSEGTVEENLAKGNSLDARRILVQVDQEISHAYHAWGTPAAVAVDTDGRIASGVAQGADAIRTLLSNVIHNMHGARPGRQTPALRNGHRQTAEISTLGVGDLVPPLQFTGLDGTTIPLEPAPGNSLVLLFWNPACGFCQRMLDDLRGWELNQPEDAPALFVISTGSHEENLAMELRSPIVFDDDSTAARTFGTGGTPTAVLIDSNGRVASEVVAGANAVLALVGGQQVIRA